MIVLHGAREKIRWLRFSPDGRSLVAPCPLGVQLWHLPGGGPPTTIRGFPGVTSARFTPDGAKLLLCGRLAAVVDVSSRELTQVPLELPDRPVDCELSPDGRVLVAAQRPRPDPGQAHSLNALPDAASILFCRPLAEPGSSLWSSGISGHVVGPPLFLAGGDRFVTLEWGHDRRFVTRESSTGAVVSERWTPYLGPFENPVLSPDGRLIACRQGGQVAVHSLEALQAEPLTFGNDNPKEFTGLAFHPSGRRLAVSSNDGTVKLYDTANWELAGAFDWGIGRLRSVAFSPDGMLAAAGGDQGQVVLWDVDA
jgi:WD40 repeat protein